VQTDAMMRTRLSMARIQSISRATPCGSDCSSSSGQLPAPPGTIRTSSGCCSAWAKSQSGTTEGPFMHFTGLTSLAIRNVANG
jgi:hypothetical protein